MTTSLQLLGAVAALQAAAQGGPADDSDAAGQNLPHGQQPVVTPFADGLVVVYLVDEGQHFSLVQHQQLADAGGQPRALHELGLLNLGRRAADNLRMLPMGPVHGLLLDGEFEASLLLLDDLWDDTLASHTPHGAVVAIPTRDVLTFCDAASADGIRTLRDLVQRTTAGGQQLLTPHLYRRVDGAWQRLPD